jgi:hypothetical protein
VKRLHWTLHELQNLLDREIDRTEADKTFAQPEFTVPVQFPRNVCMRRYFDSLLQQEMLLRVIVEETMTEIVVVSVYKTSQIERYLRGLIP